MENFETVLKRKKEVNSEITHTGRTANYCGACVTTYNITHALQLATH